jgi:hypothetical protein
MTQLDLPSLQSFPADMAMVLLGTFSHLLDNAAALACLQGVARHLRQGGLLVVELAHPGEPWRGCHGAGAARGPPPCSPAQLARLPAPPRAQGGGSQGAAGRLALTSSPPLSAAGDLFDGSLIVNSAGGEMWEVEQRGRKLLVEWGSELDDFDPLSQVRGPPGLPATPEAAGLGAQHSAQAQRQGVQAWPAGGATAARCRAGSPLRSRHAPAARRPPHAPAPRRCSTAP